MQTMKGDSYNFKKIAEKRKAHYTQEKFAEKLGVTVQTLSRLENGHIASYQLIVDACRHLEIDSGTILYSSTELSLSS